MVLYKKIRKLAVRTWISIHECTYTYQTHKIKYIYLDNKSQQLCVVFSGFPELGGAAHYNYIRTLKGNKNFNYLFILDDMVKIPTGGSYYLGSGGDYWGLKAIPEFIDYIKGKNNISMTVMVGSSKGGTCAILYGLMMKAEYIIAGACQYRIGSYLNCPYHIASLRELTGQEDVGKDKIKELDDIVINAVTNHKSKNTEIYIHYSKQEHTYKGHIKELLCDLKKADLQIYEDTEEYVNHGDVGKFFPAYMCSVLDKINKR